MRARQAWPARARARTWNSPIQCQLGQAPIRPDAGENLLVLHLPSHDGPLHTLALKSFNQPGEFSQGKPVDGGGAMGFDLRRSFLLDGCDNHFTALGARGIQHKEWETAVAGDETETRLRGGHAGTV